MSESENKIHSSDASPDVNPAAFFTDPCTDSGDMDICIEPSYYAPRKFLIVDDESIAQSFVGTILRNEQIDSEVVDNGLLAVEYYKTKHTEIGAILMDCHMPVMNGLKATQKIRKYEKRHNLTAKFIVAVTADNFVANKIACQKAGMNYFISKPVTKLKVERILEMLKKYIPS